MLLLMLLLATPASIDCFCEAGTLLPVGFLLSSPFAEGPKLPGFPAALLGFLRSGKGLKGFGDGRLLTFRAEEAPFSTGAWLDAAAGDAA